MIEEKTCYNCGNKNCHIFYYSVKQDVAEHHETYEYTEFDCVNHNKWEELKVEEIRTDNTETLINALERIAELEKENAELKERHTEILEAFASASSGDDFEMAESAREIMEILNIPCYRHGKVVSKLTKAKELLEDLIRFQPYIDKEAMFLSIGNEWKTAIYKAEQFLKDCEVGE